MTEIAGGKVGGSPRPFNTFFLLALLLASLAGCASGPAEMTAKSEAKDMSVMRLFTELRDDSMPGAKAVLPRSNPVEIAIDKTPFADERDVVRAQVLETLGGFGIRVELTSHGRMTLEAASVTRAGLRLVVFGQWTINDKETVVRWLAAPAMRRALRDGVIFFTPDCSRDEAERFVRGLNNVAIKLENQPKPSKSEAKMNKKPDKSPTTSGSSAEQAIRQFEERK